VPAFALAFRFSCVRSEVSTAMKIQVGVFWFVTPYSDVVRWQHFGWPRAPWRWRQRSPPKRWVLYFQCYRVSQPRRPRPEKFGVYFTWPVYCYLPVCMCLCVAMYVCVYICI
jgi:hypothetical protein